MTPDEIDKLSDDEAIALVVLHANKLQFWQWVQAPPEFAWACWDERSIDRSAYWKTVSAPTKGDAARKYCVRHNLLR